MVSPEEYEVPSGPLVVGVDVGGSKVRAALAGADGMVLVEREAETDPAGGLGVVRQIADLVVEVAGDGWEDVAAVGVGTPGTVDPATGRTAFSQNIPGMDTVDLTGELRRRLGRRVEVGNDVNLAAVGERAAGHGRGCDDLVVVSVGTGIGCGIISGGRLVAGHRGAAGELAELPLIGDVHDPEHRRQGVFESQVATGGLVRRYAQAGGRASARSGGRASPDSGRDVLAAADAGDPIAQEVVRDVARDVAVGIMALVAIVDPALVVLSGGIGAHPRFGAEVAAALPLLVDDPPQVVRSALGDRAGLVGAVHLAAAAVPRAASAPSPKPPGAPTPSRPD